MRRGRATLVFAASLSGATGAVPAALAAQSAAEICRSAFGRLAAGHWAEYQVTNSGRAAEGATTMRVAMVGSEGSGESRLYWFESKFASSRGEVIVKVLIPGWPYDPGEVRGMVMKMGNQPAMRVPENVIAMMRQRLPSSGLDAMQKCGGAQVVGRESVTVPAGTIAAVHLKPAGEPGDLWVTSELPFGLVKWSGKNGEVLLAAQGDGATSMIPEEP